MAGAQALIGSLREGKLPLCQDGLPLEPLDYLVLLFLNKGANISGSNVCFVMEHFKFPALRMLLPDPTVTFTPDDFVDCLMCFAILCIVITLGMIICKHVWEQLDPNFAAINPSHKKWYVVANLSKAFLLSLIACSHRCWFGSYKMFHDQYQIEVKRCAVIYVATDVVALYMVPKLPRSTLVHHVVTAFLVGMVTAVNLEHGGWEGLLGVCKMSSLYAVFSALAYSVNAYLALRVVYPKAAWLNSLVKISLWTYLLCCALNWSIHALWLIQLGVSLQISIFNAFYLVLLATIVHDDIVLIKWLVKRGSPMAIDKDKKD